MATDTTTRVAIDDSFDLRWRAWQAEGAAQDRQLRRHAIFVAILLGCGFAVAIAVAMYAG